LVSVWGQYYSDSLTCCQSSKK